MTSPVGPAPPHPDRSALELAVADACGDDADTLRCHRAYVAELDPSPLSDDQSRRLTATYRRVAAARPEFAAWLYVQADSLTAARLGGVSVPVDVRSYRRMSNGAAVEMFACAAVALVAAFCFAMPPLLASSQAYPITVAEMIPVYVSLVAAVPLLAAGGYRWAAARRLRQKADPSTVQEVRDADVQRGVSLWPTVGGYSLVAACLGVVFWVISGVAGFYDRGDEAPSTTSGLEACEDLWSANSDSATVSRDEYLETCQAEEFYDLPALRDSMREEICGNPANRSWITDWDEQCG